MLSHEHADFQQAFKTRRRDSSLNHPVFVSMSYCNEKTCWTLYDHSYKKLRGLSPRENYTDIAAAAGRRS